MIRLQFLKIKKDNGDLVDWKDDFRLNDVIDCTEINHTKKVEPTEGNMREPGPGK